MENSENYLQFFNLIAAPFQDLKDPRFVWKGQKQSEILEQFKNGIKQRKGLMLLTGDAGAGKTVLVNSLLRDLPRVTIAAVLRESGLNVDRLEQLLCQQLHIPPPKTTDEFRNSIKDFLEHVAFQGKYVLIVLEDSDQVMDKVLEQVRWLSALTIGEGEKLVSILLTGNRHFGEQLGGPEHAELKQLVAIRLSTEPFTAAETDAYIRHRMMVGGGFLEIFSEHSTKQIHRLTGGLPKEIDIICEYALKRACAEKHRLIDGKMTARYARDLRTGSPEERSYPALPGRKKWKPFSIALSMALSVLVLGLLLYLFQGELLKRGSPPPLPPPVFSLMFEPRSAAISSGDCQKLDAAAAYLLANPGCRVTIKSPEDSGVSSWGKKLANTRPEAVKTYLNAKGVSMDRIQTVVTAVDKKPSERKKGLDPNRHVVIEVYPTS